MCMCHKYGGCRVNCQGDAPCNVQNANDCKDNFIEVLCEDCLLVYPLPEEET